MGDLVERLREPHIVTVEDCFAAADALEAAERERDEALRKQAAIGEQFSRSAEVLKAECNRLISRLREPDEEMVEAVARGLAAHKMLIDDGSKLPGNLWRQAVSDAIAAVRAIADHLDKRGGE